MGDLANTYEEPLTPRPKPKPSADSIGTPQKCACHASVTPESGSVCASAQELAANDFDGGRTVSEHLPLDQGHPEKQADYTGLTIASEKPFNALLDDVLDISFYGEPALERLVKERRHLDSQTAVAHSGQPRSHSRVPSSGSSCSSRGISSTNTRFSHRRDSSTASTCTTSSIEVRMEGEEEHQVRKWMTDSPPPITRLPNQHELSNAPTGCDTKFEGNLSFEAEGCCEYEPIIEETLSGATVSPIQSMPGHPRRPSRVKAFFRRALLCTT